MTPDNSTLRAGEPLYCGYSGAAGKGCYDKSGRARPRIAIALNRYPKLLRSRDEWQCLIDLSI